MLRVVWGCLRLVSRDSYLATAAVLTQVINFITCTCAKLNQELYNGKRLPSELERSYSFSLRHHHPLRRYSRLPPKRSRYCYNPMTCGFLPRHLLRKLLGSYRSRPLCWLGFCATSSLAQEAKVKAMPNTTAKDFSCDANEYCFIVFFIIYSFYFVLLVNYTLLVFP